MLKAADVHIWADDVSLNFLRTNRGHKLEQLLPQTFVLF